MLTRLSSFQIITQFLFKILSWTCTASGTLGLSFEQRKALPVVWEVGEREVGDGEVSGEIILLMTGF